MSIAQEIKNYCEEREIKFVGDYSGRFMYGKKCIGYICEPNEKYNIMAGLADYLSKKNIDLSEKKILEDNVARDRIIYFPYISL